MRDKLILAATTAVAITMLSAGASAQGFGIYMGHPLRMTTSITDTDRNTDPIGRAAMGAGATATMPIWRTTEFGEAAAEHIIIGTVSAASTLAIDSPIPVGRAGA